MEKLDLKLFRSRPKKHMPPNPTAFTCDYMTGKSALKKYGDKITAFYDIVSENDFLAAVATQEDYNRLGHKLIASFLAKPKFLDKLIAWSEKKKNSLYNYLKKNLNQKIIHKLSNKQLAARYKKYVNLYQMFHLENTPSWWLGSEAAFEEVKNDLAAQNIANADDVVGKLSNATEYLTENSEEEISLLEICVQLVKLKISHISDPAVLPKKIKTLLKKHVEAFFSSPFGYNTGVIWDENYFVKKINEILAQSEPEKLLKNKLEGIKKSQQEQKKLIKELKLNAKTIALFKIMRQLSYLQEIKKTTQTKSHPQLQGVVLPEIAKRLNIPQDFLDYMSPLEIIDGLLVGKITDQLQAHIRQRLEYCVLVIEDWQYKWLVGAQAKEFFTVNGLFQDVGEVSEIKGIIANRGKVTAKVRVCRFSTEINKVQPGEILVTGMTTPDFVPAMKKASAIITDEGGITCHAAIVSRELNKPCIIGTKIATKVLKDGDMVEVDADKGVVKILK